MSRFLFEYHPTIGYHFVPGIKTRMRHEGGGYLVKCNAQGFRSARDVTAEKPKDKFRVVVFGDSLTAGDGVSNKFRYSDVLESRFADVEVLNFGLPGSGTDQQYLAWQAFCRDIEYDLLITSVFVENVERILAKQRKTISATDGKVLERPKPYFELVGDQVELRGTPVPKQATETQEDWQAPQEGLRGAVRQVYKRFPAIGRAVRRIRNDRYPQDYEDPGSPGWRLMKGILTSWIKEAGHDTLVCPLPTYEHVDKVFAADNILARFRELEGLPRTEVVDVLPAFWRLSPTERRSTYFENDGHPTRRGHQLIADALEPAIRRHYDRWRRNAGGLA